MRKRLLAALCICAWSVSSAVAQLPDPALEFVFPSGGQAGTTVAVQIGGRDLDEANRLVFSHPGLQSELETRAPGEFESGPQTIANQFRVTIASNTPPGTYEVRAVGRFGASTPRTFVVGQSPEIVDSVDNHQPQQAMPLELNSTANGRIEAGAVDYYKITGRAGQSIVLVCTAQGIDSALQPIITVWDAGKKQLARTSQTLDPVLAFAPAVDGEYTIGINDRTFSGSGTHIYRLRALTGPYVVTIDPVSAQPGSSRAFTLYGLNLPGTATPSAWKIGDAVLQQVTSSLYIPPADGTAKQLMSVSPVTAEADAFVWSDVDGGRPSIGLPIAYADYPVVLEAEPNQLPDQAQRISIPTEVSGRFYPRRDQDWVVFPAKQGDRFQVRVISHRLGLPTDPEIFVQRVTKDGNGQLQVSQVSTDDDFRANDQRYKGALRRALDLGHHDPSVSFTADQDADYRVGLRDLGGSSLDDPRLVYRLVIENLRPSFSLVAWTQRQLVDDDKKIESGGWTLRSNGRMPVLVDVSRRGGFDGPVSITAENLPAGVTARPCLIAAGQTEGVLLLVASKEASTWTGEIRVIGTATVDGQEVKQTAHGATLIGQTANVEASRPAARGTRNLVLSVTALDPAIAQIDLGNADDSRAVFRTSLGGKLAIPVKYTRSGTVKGELVMVPVGVPAEVKAGNVTLAADAAGGQLDLNIDNNKVVPGTYTIFLRGKVPTSYARNPQAIEQLASRRKAMDEMQQQFAQQIQQAEAKLADAQQALAGKADQIAKVADAQQSLQRSFDSASEQLAQAQQQLASLEQLAGASSQAEIAAAAKQAEIATKTLVDQVAAARPSLDALKGKLAEFQSSVQTAQQGVTQGEQQKKEATEKRQRAEEFIKGLDQRLTEAQTNFGPKDVTIYLDSTPITLEIVATPLDVKLSGTQIKLGPGKEQTIDVQVQRLFSFADKLTLEWEIPQGVADLKGETLVMAADQSQAGIKLIAGPQATVGRHTLQLRISLQFNGVDLQHRVPVVVEVNPQ